MGDLARLSEGSSFEENIGSDFHVRSFSGAVAQEAKTNYEKHCYESWEEGLPRVTIKPITDRADHYAKLRGIRWNSDPQEA